MRKLAESHQTVRETEAAFHGLAASITSVSGCIERMSAATGDVIDIARGAGDATADVSAATQQSCERPRSRSRRPATTSR